MFALFVSYRIDLVCCVGLFVLIGWLVQMNVMKIIYHLRKSQCLRIALLLFHLTLKLIYFDINVILSVNFERNERNAVCISRENISYLDCSSSLIFENLAFGQCYGNYTLPHC